MELTLNKSIGDYVTENFRTAAVFKKYAIDFCCKGHKTLSEVCQNKNISEAVLTAELDSVLGEQGISQAEFKSWPLDLLVDYIEKKHHRYVQKTTADLLIYLEKLAKVHGANHPELIEINKQFKESATELAAHMQKEEKILFPFIRSLVNGDSDITACNFGSVANPIAVMKSEHDTEGERFRLISDLSSAYQPPLDACQTYRVAFKMLEEFETDLHFHIHLESNILFPKAIKLEKQLKFN